MLYSLAAVDDGIKYDEWLLLGFLIEQLRLFKSASTFYRRYSGLRTEQNNYDTYSYFSSKYYGANNSNSQSFGSQKQSSGKSSSASKVDTRLAEAFEVLEISSTATKEEVQEAYHRLALQHHPDLPKNAERRAECVRAMAKINVAYATVSKSFV
ncbi:MAG: J domain-containing protein [Paludibacteraceae bacterium]|nr:J domain-containing protein [Paludibacteraceae bacterium]